MEGKDPGPIQGKQARRSSCTPLHRFGIHSRKMGKKGTWPKQPRKKEKTRKREAIKRSTASHLELQRRGLQEKIARENKKANLEFWLSGFQWSEIF